MGYNCKKNVVSNLWKGRVMSGVSVLQRIKIRFGVYFKGSAGMIIFSLFKWFLTSRLMWFKFEFFLLSEIKVVLLRGYCC